MLKRVQFYRTFKEMKFIHCIKYGKRHERFLCRLYIQEYETFIISRKTMQSTRKIGIVEKEKKTVFVFFIAQNGTSSKFMLSFSSTRLWTRQYQGVNHA